MTPECGQLADRDALSDARPSGNRRPWRPMAPSCASGR